MPENPVPADFAAGPGTASALQRGTRGRWSRVLLLVAGVLVLALAAGGVYAWRIDRSLTSNLNRGIDLPSAGPSAEPRPEALATGTLNYVLLGSDSRDPDNEGNGRSDSIMVVHLNRDRTKAAVISFPRDMYVDIPGYGRNKINAAYAFGGSELAVRTLEKLTDVRMDHVVMVGLEGFVGLTEDLGGVTVANKTAFSSHGFDYPKGQITIKGEEALWYVRERKSLPAGDFDRAENQRNVLKAIVTKGLSADVLSNPARFTTFLGNLARHVTVDNSLSDAELRRTALSLRLKPQQIELLQAPLLGTTTTAGGQSIDVVDTQRLAELSKALKQDTVDGYAKKYAQG